MNKILLNKSRTILWEDEDNRNSWKLCMDKYGLKSLKAVDVDDMTVELTVYGKAEDVDRFAVDVDEGCVEPLESASRKFEYDEDYENWLNEEIQKFDTCKAVESNEVVDDPWS